MWWRRSWFSLKGKADIPGQTEGCPATSIGPRVLPVGSLQQRGVSALRWQADDNVWPILVFDAADRARPQHPPSFDLGTLRLELPVVVGRVERQDTTPADRNALAA